MSLKVVVVASLVVAAWSVGCGNDPTSAVDEPAGGPAARAVDEPTGSRLRERAVELYAHMSQERWADVHRYLSPAIRDGCPADHFTERMALGWTYAKSVLGLAVDERLELRVHRVEVEDVRGGVHIELFRRGQSLGTAAEDEAESWRYVEGDWVYEIAVGDDGCPSSPEADG